jgi:hypothetical protein
MGKSPEVKPRDALLAKETRDCSQSGIVDLGVRGFHAPPGPIRNGNARAIGSGGLTEENRGSSRFAEEHLQRERSVEEAVHAILESGEGFPAKPK